jgi:hypothetical protein
MTKISRGLFVWGISFGGVDAFTKDQDQFLTSFLLGIGHGYWVFDIGDWRLEIQCRLVKLSKAFVVH